MQKRFFRKSNIEWYTSFFIGKKIPNKWKNDLHALLPQFEKGVLSLQRDVNYFLVLKSIISGSIYKYELVDPIPTEKIIFWPFQFLHCDFMVIVMKHLKEKNIPYSTLVFRKNLVPYLSEKGESAEYLTFERELKPFFEILTNLSKDLIFLIFLLFKKGTLGNKRILLSILVHTFLLRKVEAAAQWYIDRKKKQFNFIGYDLSMLGRVLIRIANDRGVATGRIQNGAPNYLLSGYSEVKYMFFWEQLSKEVYERRGFKGNSVITGNILFQQKQRTETSSAWLEALAKKANQTIEGRKIVFVALSGPGHNTSEEGHRATLEIINEILKQFPETIFLIKLHPKDSLKYFSKVKEQSNAWFTQSLPQDIQPDALDILLKSDFLITGASSVALDAFSLGCGVISVDPLRELEHFDFIYENEEVIKIFEQKDVSSLNHLFFGKSTQIQRLSHDGISKIMDVLSPSRIS